jgi:hypothetical protein
MFILPKTNVSTVVSYTSQFIGKIRLIDGSVHHINAAILEASRSHDNNAKGR